MRFRRLTVTAPLEKIPSIGNNPILVAAAGLLSRVAGTKPVVELPTELGVISDAQLELTTLIDTLMRMGIMKRLLIKEPFSDEPYQHRAAALPHGHGGSFFSAEAAIMAAVAENVERFYLAKSGEFYKDKIVRASYQDLRPRALDINKIVGFSPAQRSARPDWQVDENTPLAWIRTDELVSNTKRYCPLQLLSQHYESSRGEEPLVRRLISTGLSTASSLNEACLKGILEVVERDAFMIAYLNKLTPPRVDIERIQDERIQRLYRQFRRYRLMPHFILLPTDFPVHVVLCVLVDETAKGPKIAVGARASFDLKVCVIDSLSEAHRIRVGSKLRYANHPPEGRITKLERLLLWAQMSDTAKIDFLISGPLADAQANPLAEASAATKLDALTACLRRKSYSCYVQELTPRKVRQLGLRSIMAVVPELQPLHLDESMPFFFGERLRLVPRLLGYKPAESFNTVPHPFG
jgi:ribosomal protein S12 methylthiotransferase accessory factor